MKKENKFLIMSLVYGILPIICIDIVNIIELTNLSEIEFIYQLEVIIIVFSIIIAPIFAILFGIRSLKLEKRKLSIIGILLGVITIITIITLIYNFFHNFQIIS